MANSHIKSIILAIAVCLLPLSHVLAAEGINTEEGIPLPIGAGGIVAMMVMPEGNIGIGTAAPAATLSVAGGVQVGTDPVCTPAKRGTLSYEPRTRQLLVCEGATFQLVGGGSGTAGGFVKSDNPSFGTRGCIEGNPFAADQGCSCPEGFVPAPISKTLSTQAYGSNANTGYICFQERAVAQAEPDEPDEPVEEAALGHWVRDPGPEQWSCADAGTNPDPNTPASYCNPPALVNPCSVGETGYVAAHCSYGTTFSNCVVNGRSVPGWSLGYYTYSCIP